MRFLILTLFAMMMCVGGSAHAQLGGQIEPVTPSLEFGAPNKQLQDMLQIQYQMQILKRIIEREKVVNQMVRASLDVGVTNPYIPEPDYSLCQKVPGNLTCNDAYKDLYPEFNKEIAPAPLPVAAAPIPGISTDITLNTPSLSAETLADSQSLVWLDVTCFVEKCSAIVSTDPNDARARYRITVGEKLPDGAVVERISVNGVILTQGDQEIHLNPAPKTPQA